MNFTITISGEKNELPQALKTLKAVMGDQIGAGEVSATIEQPSSAPTAQPFQTAAPVTPTAAVPTQQPSGGGYTQQAPTAQAPAQQQPSSQAAVPTTAASYSQEQLAVAATQLMDAGRGDELRALLNNSFGVQSLMTLPQERYGEFATALRSLGAKI